MPLYNVFLVGVPTINIISSVFYAVRMAVKEEDPAAKKMHYYIGFFPLMVMFGGFLQMIISPSTPIFCFSCTILMLIFYIYSLEDRISLDPLTGLNNRGQLQRYVTQLHGMRRDGRRTVVYMLDLNDFKNLNDTYGHAAGDQALVLLAEALKNVVNRYNIPSFLGRYGGDEFIIIMNPFKPDDIASVSDEIRTEIDSVCESQSTPYRIAVGIGFDELLDAPDTFQKCLQRADSELYIDKTSMKTGAAA